MSEVSFGGSFAQLFSFIELGIIHHSHPSNQGHNNGVGVGLLKLEFTVDGQGFIFAV